MYSLRYPPSAITTDRLPTDNFRKHKCSHNESLRTMEHHCRHTQAATLNDRPSSLCKTSVNIST
ncbi:hypothetical protein HanRHA438_Chr14g0676691 [Helianthus annuus]|nr:hypothetical protein HanRHA438_Chr14g0676691 [Helianthus annuus]